MHDGLLLSRAYGNSDMPQQVAKYLDEFRELDDVQAYIKGSTATKIGGGWSLYPGFRCWAGWGDSVGFCEASDELDVFHPDLMVCDLGCSKLKVRFRGLRRDFARNFDYLPSRRQNNGKGKDDLFERLREFVSKKARSVVDEAKHKPSCIVFGVPIFHNNIFLHSYTGMSELTRAEDFFGESDWCACPVVTMTNIELMALASCGKEKQDDAVSSILLSLGVNPVAAILDRHHIIQLKKYFENLQKFPVGDK